MAGLKCECASQSRRRLESNVILSVDVTTSWRKKGDGDCRGADEMTFYEGSHLDKRVKTRNACAQKCMDVSNTCTGFWFRSPQANDSSQNVGCMTYIETITNTSGTAEGECYVKDVKPVEGSTHSQ